MSYLLDTNHCVYLMNGWTKPIGKQKSEDIKVCSQVDSVIASTHFYLSTVVLGELYYGAYNSAQVAANLNRIAILKTKFNILDVDEDLFLFYGQTRASFAKKGIQVENFDLTIASIAMYNNLILLSNDHIFNHLKPDLKVENWAI